ncbi:carbohydrate deacetylase [Candidatus Latescibacterota bacterium]
MKKITRIHFSIFTLIFGISVLVPDIINAEDIKLIIRGDDLGSTQGSLVAFERAFNEGVLTCASILTVAPWFEGAAELCIRNPGWSVGVHLTLVGEWRGYRWRPVLPWDKVSSLVDEDGFFYSNHDELFAQKPKLEEINSELRAQIDFALKKGIKIQHIDMHYMLDDSYPGFIEVLNKIAHDYNLPISGKLEEKSIGIFAVPIEQKLENAVKMLEELESGLYLWVCHPGIDSHEQRALVHSFQFVRNIESNVGAARTAVLQIITSDEVKSVIKKKGIKLTDYKELWKNNKH